jgi:hypothetical protein
VTLEDLVHYVIIGLRRNVDEACSRIEYELGATYLDVFVINLNIEEDDLPVNRTVDRHPKYAVCGAVLDSLPPLFFPGLINYGLVITSEVDFALRSKLSQVECEYGFLDDFILVKLVDQEVHCFIGISP